MGVTCVIGAQLGSEAKGHVVGRIARQYGHHVRVGAANAGHTVYIPTLANDMGMVDGADDTGAYEKKVLQQIPVAAYAHPGASLYIGPGAVISPDVLIRELRELDAWRMEAGADSPTIFVDYRAHVITQEHITRETWSDLAERIGSTSATAREGIGTAMADRVLRAKSCVMAQDFFTGRRWDCVQVVDVPSLLASVDNILIEGTQGTGLSLTTGSFPFVTSRNTTAAGLCADAGIAPTRVDRVIGVARTYPIRVAGNSGPFPTGSDEITWESIGVDPDSERTTVTKKVRRVATIGWGQLAEAAYLNGVTEWYLMFADYIDPSLRNLERVLTIDDVNDKFPKVMAMVDQLTDVTGVQVTAVGTGPRTMIVFSS